MMDYYVIEVKAQHGRGPWLPMNIIKSQGGKLAIDLAERIRRKITPKFSRTFHRVRPVSYEEYIEIGTELAGRYNCQDRLDLMENLLIGCDALISA